MKGSQLLPHANGIYKITNLLNGRVYIGQSKDIYVRYNSHHKYEYKNENRADFQLYQAFKKYGLDNFSFIPIANCPKEYNHKLEQHIKDRSSFNSRYNIAINCEKPQFGMKLSEESKYLISKANKGKVWTDEQKERLKYALKKNKEHDVNYFKK